MGEAMKSDLVLSEEEIVEITHRKRPKEQLKDLIDMGIRATLRKHDNTVCVLRAYVTNPAALAGAGGGAENAGPQRKSAKQ